MYIVGMLKWKLKCYQLSHLTLKYIPLEYHYLAWNKIFVNSDS